MNGAYAHLLRVNPQWATYFRQQILENINVETFKLLWEKDWVDEAEEDPMCVMGENAERCTFSEECGLQPLLSAALADVADRHAEG